MAQRAHQFLSDRGDLSAYLAVAMLLPLLLLIGFGGAQIVHAVGLRSAIYAASYDALRTVEDGGGVTPSLTSSLSASLTRLSGTAVSVRGTASGQPWGQAVCLQVNAPSKIWLLAGGLSIQLGGSFCGTSDLPPLGP